jgi:predicted ATP-grasp superfamily ATP-dependent carboligase
MTRHPAPSPALVLGADSAIGLTVIRELGRHGVPVVAVGSAAHAVGGASRYATRFHQRPKGGHPSEWLPELIATMGATALFAVSEGDLLDLATMPLVIAGCRILTPRQPQLDIVLDKTRTLAAARSVGIDTPASWQPLTGEDFAATARTLAYPLVLKWADPPAILSALAASGIPFEKAEYVTGSEALLEVLARYDRIGTYPIAQTYVRGYGFGQMLMIGDGAVRLRFQHQRLREFPPSGGVSTLCASVPIERHSEQMAKSEALLTAIGWEGPAMVEYRHDPESGRYWLMEVNGRFWGSLPLASQSGAHFAWEQYRHAVLGEPAEALRPYRARRARYAIPDTKRLVQVLRRPDCAGPGQPAFRRADEALGYIVDFVDPRTGTYVWSWSDPNPFFRDVLSIVSKLTR